MSARAFVSLQPARLSASYPTPLTPVFPPHAGPSVNSNHSNTYRNRVGEGAYRSDRLYSYISHPASPALQPEAHSFQPSAKSFPYPRGTPTDPYGLVSPSLFSPSGTRLLFLLATRLPRVFPRGHSPLATVPFLCRHTSQSFSVASTMALAALCSQRPLRFPRSRRTAGIARGLPK